MRRNQTVKILLILGSSVAGGLWRSCEGGTPKARRNAAEKWLGLANPSARLSSVNEPLRAATSSSEACSRSWLR
jgi:hypothetical protein